MRHVRARGVEDKKDPQTSPRKRKLTLAERKHFLRYYNKGKRVPPPEHAAHLETPCRILGLAPQSAQDPYRRLSFRKGKRVFTVTTHTLSLRHFHLNGDVIPKGMLARHKCDRKACSEATHLELGSHAENFADRLRAAEWKGDEK